MIMKMRGDKCHPGRGKRVKIPLLPNNVGNKIVNGPGPQQGHNKDAPFHRVTSTAPLARHTLSKSWLAQMRGTTKEVLAAEHKVKKECREDIVFIFHFVFPCKN